MTLYTMTNCFRGNRKRNPDFLDNNKREKLGEPV